MIHGGGVFVGESDDHQQLCNQLHKFDFKSRSCVPQTVSPVDLGYRRSHMMVSHNEGLVIFRGEGWQKASPDIYIVLLTAQHRHGACALLIFDYLAPTASDC